jgi:esterase/lipase
LNPTHRSLFLILLVLLLLSACSFGGISNPLSSQAATPTVVQPSGNSPTETPEPPTATPEPFSGEGPWEISFTTTDSVALYGVLYGQGEVAVILAPSYPGGIEGWQPFAEKLAAQGYRVFTFDFRGQGKSKGTRSSADAPTDLTAAITVMRENIAERVVVMGAGLGGMAAIQAVPQNEGVLGLAVLSSARSFDGLEITDENLAALNVPSLWLGTRNDMTQNVEDMYNVAGGTDKQLWIYEGSSLHGTFMLEGADRPDLEQRLLEFVAHVAGG